MQHEKVLFLRNMSQIYEYEYESSFMRQAGLLSISWLRNSDLLALSHFTNENQKKSERRFGSMNYASHSQFVPVPGEPAASFET